MIIFEFVNDWQALYVVNEDKLCTLINCDYPVFADNIFVKVTEYGHQFFFYSISFANSKFLRFYVVFMFCLHYGKKISITYILFLSFNKIFKKFDIP